MFRQKFVLLLVFAFICAGSAQAQSIGVVKTLLGDAQLLRHGKISEVKLGDEVRVSDTLRTLPQSSLGILFHDDTRIGAGPETSLTLGSYQFDSQTQQGQAFFSIESGTLALIGGKMAINNLDAIRVETPTSMLSASCSTLSVKVDSLTEDTP